MATSAKAAKDDPAGSKPSGVTAGAKAQPAGDTGKSGNAAAKKQPGLRIGDLVTRITEATGARKGTVRSVVEAAILEINRALEQGEAVVLPGLGRVWVTKSAERNGRIIRTAKIRGLDAGEAAAKAGEPLAKGGSAG